MKLLQQSVLLAMILLSVLPAFSPASIFVELYQQFSSDKYPEDSNIFKLLGTGIMTEHVSGTNIFIYPEKSLRLSRRHEPEGNVLIVWNRALFPSGTETACLQADTSLNCTLLTAKPDLQGASLFFVLPSRNLRNLRYVRHHMKQRAETGDVELQLTLTDIEWCPKNKEDPCQNIRKSEFFLDSTPTMALSRIVDELLSREFNPQLDTKVYDDIFFVPPDSGIQIYIFNRQKQRRKVIIWVVTPDAQQFFAVFGFPRVHKISSDESSPSPSRASTPSGEWRRGSGGSMLKELLKEKLGKFANRSRGSSISEEEETK